MSQQSFNITSAVHSAFRLYEEEQYHECVDICIQILGIDCTRADIWNLAGIVMLKLELYEKAVEYFAQAAHFASNDLSHRINLAEAYRRGGNPRASIDELTLLLEQEKAMEDNPTLHFNLAKAYSDIEDSQNSIRHYTIAIKLDPNDLGAMFNLANAQVSLKHFGEAIELYLNALSKGYLDAGVNLANTYVQIGLFSEALEVYRGIYQYYKDDSDFLFNYANALNYANASPQDTQTLYQQAIGLNPQRSEYCINYAHFLLKHLDLTNGFRIYEERKKLPNMLPQGITKLWERGECLSDKNVLVYHEQGLGDSIMFSRFVPLLQKVAKNVIVLIQEPLLPLFQKFNIPCICGITEDLEYDVAISLLSLPYALGISHKQELESLPLCDTPRIKAHRVKKIGICFSTDSAFPESANKNIPLEVLMNALKDAQSLGVEIHSLNKAHCENLADFGIIQKPMNDFLQTYEIIKEMDLVISIDTAVAHLSGSMGKHTLVLLNKRYDWRWGNGISTPWYENVLCMMQSKIGQWSDVAHNLKSYLGSYI
ncbi:tetratricopeptide repeat protein [Helicobacter labetoulli]|uniref:tetratricopeptide repeat-containing glycosyltransferase family protein n=1 Tax=Helicobacter labetoulli TaxID=2315333 RepID=UPI000EF7438B|nr:tetratricopeptide repeat protein [Helicobacter labetoulli]